MNDLQALLSERGAPRELFMRSQNNFQFKLNGQHLSIPRRISDGLELSHGEHVFVRLNVASDDTPVAHSIVSAWPEMTQCYAIQITASTFKWTFWYQPTQTGPKAKAAATKVIKNLDILLRGSTESRLSSALSVSDSKTSDTNKGDLSSASPNAISAESNSLPGPIGTIKSHLTDAPSDSLKTVLGNPPEQIVVYQSGLPPLRANPQPSYKVLLKPV